MRSAPDPEVTRHFAFLISTLNRPNSLTDLITSFNALTIPSDLSVRVVIADNSPDNNLKTFAETVDCRIPIIWTHQPRIGTSHGRNHCLKFVRPSESICFIDDDIILPNQFLADALRALDKYDEMGLIGGRVELYNQQDLPITIKTDTDLQIYNVNMTPFGFIHGCCMIVRSEVLNEVGSFDEAMGPGTPTRAGEDSDFVFRVAKHGYGVLYCPDVFVYHNHGRRDPTTMVKLLMGYWDGAGAVYAKHILRLDIKLMKLLYWQIRSDLRGKKKFDYYGSKVTIGTKYRRYFRGACNYVISKIKSLFQG